MKNIFHRPEVKMAVIFVLLMIFLWATVSTEMARVGAGLILALLIPGYCVVRSLWPANDLAPVEQVIFSLFFSLALDTIVIYFLNRCGIRLTFFSGLMTIVIASVIGLSLRYIRRPSLTK